MMEIRQIRGWFVRLFSIFHRRRRDREFAEELESHLAMHTEDNLRAGLVPEEARRRALVKLGGVTQVQELHREQRGLPLLEILFQDLRFGARMLFKNPGFSLIAVVTLALGIGATSAIFSVVNAVLLRPLPFPEPDRLMVYSAFEQDSRAGRINALTGSVLVEWRNRCSSCAQMSAYIEAQPGNLTGGAEPERVRIARITENLFATLGVRPLLGRTFLPEEVGRPSSGGDDQQNNSTVVILSYGLWQRRFGADPSVIGKTVKVEGDVCAVVGVMPEGFKFPDEADAWLPITLNPMRNDLNLIARLQPRVTPAQAQAELTTLAQRLQQEASQKNRTLHANLIPLQEQIVGDVRSALMILLGAVSFVLLIACANVANLLLARAATRQKEMAVRAALGASRLRIIRQLLTESLLLALAGGVLGLWLASGVLELLVAFAPQGVPRLTAIRIDPWALGFTLLLSTLTGIIFGLAPALQASRLDLNTALKEGGTRGTGSGSHHRLRSLLVVAEVSLALVLLIGAGLLLKSFTRLRETKLGFNPDRVLTASVELPQADYPTTAKAKAYADQSLARLAVRPEVQAVGVVNSLPLSQAGVIIRGVLGVEGESRKRPPVGASKVAVSADYFRALGIPLLQGRAFNERDTADSPSVLIISESLAHQLWPHGSALGKRLDINLPGETWREVVGVVGDVRQSDLNAPLAVAIYEPYSQVSDKIRWFLGDITFVIRTTSEPQNFITTLRSELQTVDKELPLHNVATMEQVVAQQVTDPRFYTLLLGSFSALALILSAAGIYSVISYSVTQRTHEIGIRLALGARAGDVQRLIVGQGMTLALLGVALGLGGAFAATRLLRGLLYDSSATDPLTFVGVALLLALVALLACWIPARRATKVDPLIALRRE
jgi:putative ABC transport system permease protein